MSVWQPHHVIIMSTTFDIPLKTKTSDISNQWGVGGLAMMLTVSFLIVRKVHM